MEYVRWRRSDGRNKVITVSFCVIAYYIFMISRLIYELKTQTKFLKKKIQMIIDNNSK